MGVSKIPATTDPEVKRTQPDKVWFELWYNPAFPLVYVGGKLDKVTVDGKSTDGVVPVNVLLGLKDDMFRTGYVRNPIIIWNHHELRGKKQPYWLVRAGANRVWCADQLGWTTIPAIVTAAPGEYPVHKWGGERISVEALQTFFPDGGITWANEHGIGLQLAKKPQVTYADYEPSPWEVANIKPTAHHRTKIVNPLIPEKKP